MKQVLGIQPLVDSNGLSIPDASLPIAAQKRAHKQIAHGQPLPEGIRQPRHIHRFSRQGPHIAELKIVVQIPVPVHQTLNLTHKPLVKATIVVHANHPVRIKEFRCPHQPDEL